MTKAPTSPARRILVVGDVMIDIVARLAGPVAQGSDTRAAISQAQGGSGANAAAWLAYFGAEVTLAARVAAADLAAQTAALRACGVTPALAADPKRPTGRLIALVGTDGERSFLTDRGANLNLCPADLPVSLLDGIGHLHISGYAFFAEPPRGAARALLAEAMARAIPVSVDASSTSFLHAAGPQNFLSWTRGAQVCFANEEEALALSAGDARFGTLSAQYPTLVVKRGAAGAQVFTAEGAPPHSRAAPGVTAIDSTGAGDAFLGAWLAARWAGANAEVCLRAAVDAGAQAVQLIGGRPPPRAVVDSMATTPMAMRA